MFVLVGVANCVRSVPEVAVPHRGIILVVGCMGPQIVNETRPYASHMLTTVSIIKSKLYSANMEGKDSN